MECVYCVFVVCSSNCEFVVCSLYCEFVVSLLCVHRVRVFDVCLFDVCVFDVCLLCASVYVCRSALVGRGGESDLL